MTALTLSDAELEEITGGLTQPAAQLRELHNQGYVRACRPRKGPVVLTRVHYEAVQASQAAAAVHNDPAGTVVSMDALREWAKGRKNGGQKAQGR